MILRPPITTLTDTLFPYTTLFRSQDRLGLFKYLDNGGDARIYGVETSLAVRPAHFVTLRSAITWNKATLQNFYDPQNGRPPVEPGDPLPGAPKWTISNTIRSLVDRRHRSRRHTGSSLRERVVQQPVVSGRDEKIGRAHV